MPLSAHRRNCRKIGIPVAELFWHVAPGRTGSHHPEDRVEYTTVIARRATATTYQERLEYAH